MSGAERRQWPRIPASLLSNLTASIIAGPDVKLVNLSRGGALMEVAARYPMRSRVRMKLSPPGGAVTQVNGTVSWAKVASISNGKINYLLAVIFENPIEDLAAATGLDDIENHPGVSMVADPFENTDIPVPSISLTASDTVEAPLVAPQAARAAEPEFREEDLSHAIFPSRGVPGPPLSAASIASESSPGADGLTLVDREALAAAAARAEELRRELDRTASELAELSAANDNLSTQLQAYDEDRIRLRSELEAARLNWDEERSSLTERSAQTVAHIHELQAALQLHQQSGGRALAEQQALAQTLSARLEMVESERATLRTDIEGERDAWKGRLADGQRAWDEERASLAAQLRDAHGRISEIEQGLRERDGSRDQALNEARDRQQELQAKLDAFDQDRDAWAARLEHERHAWQEERIALSAAAASAAAHVTSLEAALAERESAHAQALAGAQSQHRELQARLDAIDEERQQWDGTRARLEEAVASSSAVVGQLQDRIEGQDHAHRQAMDDARALHQRLEARLERFEAERVEWEASREAERASWREERHGLVQQADAAAARVEALEEALRSLRDDQVRELAEQQAVIVSLTAQLEVFDAERLQLQRELEGERTRWADDRAGLLAEAEARSEEFQAALEAREQIHADALVRERRRFEALVAELMQASNDQQAEYQQLMAERTAAFEEQVSRVERVHAELGRVRGEAEQQLASLQARCQQLEARTQAAEAVSVALETRHREVCREAERLVALLGSHGTAVAADEVPILLAAAGDAAQAVA